MAIHSISKAEWLAFGPDRNPMLDAIATEKAWFRDDAKNVIASLFVDHADKDWNFVVLGRDERGKFRWIAGDSSFETRELALEKLTAKMLEFEKSGETVFPQGD